MANHYEILGIDKTATTQQVREAYKSLAKRYHPDKNINNPHAEETFKRINMAYQVLSNEQKRRNYDYNQSYQDIATAYNSGYYQPNPSTNQTPYRNTTQESFRPKKSVYRPSSKYRYAHIPKRVRRNLNILATVVGLSVLFFGFYIYDASRVIAARHRYNKALEYIKEYDYYMAVRNLHEAVGFNPKLVEAHLLMGKINDSVYNQPDVAYINYSRAIYHSEKPTLEMYYKRGLNALRAKKFQWAAEDFGQVEVMAPKKAENYYHRALAYIGLQQKHSHTTIGKLACEDFHKAYQLGYAPAHQSFFKHCIPILPNNLPDFTQTW